MTDKRISFIRINRVNDYSVRSLFILIIVLIAYLRSRHQKSIIIILNSWHPSNKFNISSIILFVYWNLTRYFILRVLNISTIWSELPLKVVHLGRLNDHFSNLKKMWVLGVFALTIKLILCTFFKCTTELSKHRVYFETRFVWNHMFKFTCSKEFDKILS